MNLLQVEAEEPPSRPQATSQLLPKPHHPIISISPEAAERLGALVRMERKLAPVAPNPSLSHAADYLQMIWGHNAPSDKEAAAMDAYLVTAIDHGLNASTLRRGSSPQPTPISLPASRPLTAL